MDAKSESKPTLENAIRSLTKNGDRKKDLIPGRDPASGEIIAKGIRSRAGSRCQAYCYGPKKTAAEH